MYIYMYILINTYMNMYIHRVELIIDDKSNKKSAIWRSIFHRLLFLIETTAMLRRLESIEIAQALLISDSESGTPSARKTLGANSRRYSGKLSIILAGPPDDVSIKDDDDLSNSTISVRRSSSELLSPGSRRSSVKRNSIKSAPLHTPRGSEKKSFERNSLSPALPPLSKSRSETGNLDKLPTINKSPSTLIRNKSVIGPSSPVTSIRSKSVTGPPSPVTNSSVADGNTHTVSPLKRPHSGAHLQPMKESPPVTASRFDSRGTKASRSPVTSRIESSVEKKSTDQKIVRSNSSLISLNPIPPNAITPPSPGRTKVVASKSLGTSGKESSSAEPSSKRIPTVTSDQTSKRIVSDSTSKRISSDPTSKRNSAVNIDSTSKRISNGSNDPSSKRISNVNSEASSKRNSTVGIDTSSKGNSTVNLDPASKRNSTVAALPLPVVVKKKEKPEVPRSEILLRHLKSGISFSKLFGGSKGSNDSSSPQSLRNSFLGAGSTEKGNSEKGNDKEMVINENYSEVEDKPKSEVVDTDKVSQALQKNSEFNVTDKGSPSQTPSLSSILSREPSAKLSKDNSISKLFRSISIKNVGSLFKSSSEKN
jgi:hypothetical protein